MLIGYFNAFQLHDWVVTARDPGLFETVDKVIVKPLQILGFIAPTEDFNISVMLTKEYFPEHWELRRAASNGR